jgi:hypothetical protein
MHIEEVGEFLMVDYETTKPRAIRGLENLQKMIEYGKEAGQRNNQISALLNESLVNDLLKEKERGRLTAKGKKLLDKFLNEKPIDGSPLWRPSPPKNNIEEGG